MQPAANRISLHAHADQVVGVEVVKSLLARNRHESIVKANRVY